MISDGLGYPKEYTIPLTTSWSRVVGVYIKAGVPESSHSHNGGILVHRASPIKVYSFPDNRLIYESKDTSDALSAELLPKARPHYSYTPENYSAVFIESIAKVKTVSKKHEWEATSKNILNYFDGYWKVKINEKTKLKMGEQEGFAISQHDLDIYKVSKGTLSKVAVIPKLPYNTYHLQTDKEYVFKKSELFFLVGI